MATIEEVHGLFADYVNSSGKLPDLQNLSQEIDQEIANSRMFIAELKSMFNSIDKRASAHDVTCNDLTRHEDISQFLESGSVKLLLPDMNAAVDLDIDESISKFKTIIAELKQNTEQKTLFHHADSKMLPLELEVFASSLEHLCSGLVGIQSIKYDSKSFNKNEELEEKLPKLCQEVELFTKMVQSKTKLSQCNEEWKTNEIAMTLPYSEIVKCLLTSINDVTFKFLEFKKMFEINENL